MSTKKKALITGITGFVGKFLNDLLATNGYEVIGLDRWDKCPYPSVNYHQIDILDSSELMRLFATEQPDEIYHLAAISFLPEADASPKHALDINIMGSVSVLDSMKQACPTAKTLVIGSSKEYNDQLDSLSVSESIHPEPTNFYGISKYATELIGLQYVRQYGLDIRFTRSFNHTGPGQSPRFVCSDWAKQVAQFESGLSEPIITVGNLSAEIDFTDVRDVVNAYYMILEKGQKGGIYNVCSGIGISLKAILDHLVSKSSKNVQVKMAESKLRAHKTNTRMIGDNSQLKNDTGWTPKIPITQTLDDLLSWWMNDITMSRKV